MNTRTVLAMAGIIAVVMLLPSGINANADHPDLGTHANPPGLAEDSVGGISVRAEFDFHDGFEQVDSFKIFNQLGGYGAASEALITEAITFNLIGAPGADKKILYHVTDETYRTRGNPALKSLTQFDVLVTIFQGEEVLRHFFYNDCRINNYGFTTLYDDEETFSGKTKFVYADVFTFECRGFTPHSPMYEPDYSGQRTTKNTLDIDPSVLQTWRDFDKVK